MCPLHFGLEEFGEEFDEEVVAVELPNAGVGIAGRLRRGGGIGCLLAGIAVDGFVRDG